MCKKTTLLMLLAILGVAVWGVLGAYEPAPGAKVLRLPGRCELIYFDTTLQPISTLALACPRQGMVRLWPWSVVQPWFEEPGRVPGDAVIG